MRTICALLLCLTLVGCASSEQQTSTVRTAQDQPRAVSDQQLREDITEAVLRHMCQPGPADISHPITREHKVYFLSISQWYDPRAGFLKRLNDLGAPVKPISAGEWSGGFIYDRATRERGAAFQIDRIAMLSDDEADVDAVVQPGGPRSSCGWFYRLNRKDGKWVVVREKWKWVS
jgi:hypothetical protein